MMQFKTNGLKKGHAIALPRSRSQWTFMASQREQQKEETHFRVMPSSREPSISTRDRSASRNFKWRRPLLCRGSHWQGFVKLKTLRDPKQRATIFMSSRREASVPRQRWRLHFWSARDTVWRLKDGNWKSWKWIACRGDKQPGSTGDAVWTPINI